MKLFPVSFSLHDRRTATRFWCGGTLATTLTSLAVFLLLRLLLRLPEAAAAAEAAEEASAGCEERAAAAAADLLTAKRFPDPRCLASHTSESSDLPMTRSKSKARENANVSGSSSEGEGSRSVAEEAVTCFGFLGGGERGERERKRR